MRTKANVSVSLPFDWILYLEEIAQENKVSFSEAIAKQLQKAKAYDSMIRVQLQEKDQAITTKEREKDLQKW